MIDDRADADDLRRALALMDVPEHEINGHQPASPRPQTGHQSRLLVDRWLRDCGVEYVEKQSGDRVIYSITCPFNPEHADDANVTQFTSGATSAGCFHASCAGKGWSEFKEAIGRPKPEHFDPPLTRIATATDPTAAKPRFQINSITAAEFAAADYRQRFYIRKILVANQMCIVGGAQKTLKTSITGDMLFSLGTGTRFLNEFDVPEAVPVGFISAESGEFGLQEVFRRIAFARGRLLSSAMLHMYFRPVQLGRTDHLDALVEWIHRHELKVLAVDPAFLCMSVDDNGQAINFASVFSVGSILSHFMEAIIGAGCTPIINHHESKGANSFRRRGDHGPPELADLSMAGFAEAARQWLLIARREPYEHGSGFHQLWLNAGGSAGHGGLWAVDVNEGQLQDDFTGRKWEVTVNTATEARKSTEGGKAEAAKQRATQQLVENTAKVEAVLAANPDGLTFTKLRERTGIKTDKLQAVMTALEESKRVEKCILIGANKQPYDGFKIVTGDTGDTGDASGTVPLFPSG